MRYSFWLLSILPRIGSEKKIQFLISFVSKIHQTCKYFPYHTWKTNWHYFQVGVSFEMIALDNVCTYSFQINLIRIFIVGYFHIVSNFSLLYSNVKMLIRGYGGPFFSNAESTTLYFFFCIQKITMSISFCKTVSKYVFVFHYSTVMKNIILRQVLSKAHWSD